MKLTAAIVVFWFFSENVQLLWERPEAAVGVGVVLIVLAAVLFSWPRKRSSALPGRFVYGEGNLNAKQRQDLLEFAAKEWK